MTSFSASTTKGNFNPYRHGVLMGNFVEDDFGMDLQKRYQTESTVQGSGYKKPFPISEFTDKYRWPVKGKETFVLDYNEKIKANNTYFNKNIDFTKTDCNDYVKQLQDNNTNNNKINNNQINTNGKTNRNGLIECNQSSNN
jgi:hypothetical protein